MLEAHIHEQHSATHDDAAICLTKVIIKLHLYDFKNIFVLINRIWILYTNTKLSFFSNSYDTRVPGPSAHWVDEAYIGRAHWHSVPSAGLKMLEIKGRDRAIYRCRVDFHVSPTRNYKIALDVI
ncbi:hypothetical protein SFRURICE_014815, partial [Spodoptera frugiperda]